MKCNWKLETSATTTSPPPPPTTAINGVPMFPPTTTSRPPARERGGDQLGRRGLAVRTRDRDERHGAALGREVDLAAHRHTRSGGALQERVPGPHAGTRHHEVGAVDGCVRLRAGVLVGVVDDGDRVALARQARLERAPGRRVADHDDLQFSTPGRRRKSA